MRRLRVLRGMHHGLHLRRDRVSVDTPKGKKAWVNPILCKGDGLCNAKCPTNAIFLKHFTDEDAAARSMPPSTGRYQREIRLMRPA
jgi:NAD-dependent dihydropyrimidine dehydrogenase PreA subunit